MEQKKTSKADLENKKNTFFLFGLVLALGITLLAFEWTSRPKKAEDLGKVQSQAVEDVFVPITREQEIKPQLPPPQTIDLIKIVENDAEIIDELEIEETDITDETMIDVSMVVTAKDEKDEKDEIFFNIIEEPAEFPGGDRALNKYISDHINYPRIALENGVEGKVIVQFVVDEQGNASDAQIIRSVDTNLDNEALRVIKTLPKFKPGKQRGKAVKVYFVAPISFRLE